VYGQVKSSTPSTSSKATSSEALNHGTPTTVALPPGGPTFDSLDLKLMHHFCTSTAASLSQSTKAQDVWRNVIPLYAHTHHMLMHGVLTLAANHYVYMYKSTLDAVTVHEYRTRALYHHQMGLQIFRQRVQDPSDSQSEILLAFAAVIGMLTFADADLAQQTLTFDVALNVLAVIRGKQALWKAGTGMPETSDLAPAFFDPPPPEHRTDLSSTVNALTQLHDTAGDDVRRTSITILKMVAENQSNSEFRLLGTWTAAISDEFLHLLKLRDQVALRTFEHYCTILDTMRALWWVGDFGQKLRAAIRSELQTPGRTPEATQPIGDNKASS
jgi:hypothetical protein